MNLTPEIYAEICKQNAFISALVAGFSFYNESIHNLTEVSRNYY